MIDCPICARGDCLVLPLLRREEVVHVQQTPRAQQHLGVLPKPNFAKMYGRGAGSYILLTQAVHRVYGTTQFVGFTTLRSLTG